MLFSYPDNTASYNWLHECLIEMFSSLKRSIDQQTPVQPWPECIPELAREKLKRKTSVKDAWTEIVQLSTDLNCAELSSLFKNLKNQNEIILLLSAEQSDVDKFEDLPVKIREPVKKLFLAAFNILSTTGTRVDHFDDLHTKLSNSNLCPFCGLELMKRPGLNENDYDHYIPKSVYPFSAANMKNLPPMGVDCNRSYKKDKNTLFDLDNVRKKTFFPYGEEATSLKICNTYPFFDEGEEIDWRLEFVGDGEKINMWCYLFQIEERYKKELKYLYNRVVDDLSTFIFHLVSCGGDDYDEGKLDGFLRRYLSAQKKVEFIESNAFLKVSILEMLLKYIESNDRRLIGHLNRSIRMEIDRHTI